MIATFPVVRSRLRLRVSVVAVGMLAALAAFLSGAGTASAHTGFDGSVPADGSTVDAPVDTVTLTFTGEPTPAGEGFVALDPSGVVRAPTDVAVEDGRIFVLGFDPPLAGGDVGVRWSVEAADGHVLEGAFSFTVTAPAPTTAPPTTAPVSSQPASTDPPATDPVSSEPVSTDPAAAVAPDDDSSETGVAGVVSLEEFLVVDEGVPGDDLGRAGRTLGLLGVALAVGGIAFLASTLRGSSGEIGLLVLVARVSGGAVALGAAVEYLGYVRRDGVSFGDDLFVSPGLAMTLRVVGGLAIAVGLRGVSVPSSGPGAPVALSAAVAGDLVERTSPIERPARRRWRPRSSPAALVGAVLVVVSFWFDGHTVSEGVRVVHALANTVHVVAGSVWVGGVVALTVVVWRRSRGDVPTRVGELVVRFSSSATVALVAVVVAGALLAVTVLDSFGDLTGTEWGQVLVLKTVAVALAAGVGGYNHVVLRPRFEADPDDPEAAARARSTLTAEAILLGFVVVVTATLVAAATV